MLAQLSAIDKVSIVALAKKIESQEQTATISALAAKLEIPLMSESRNRQGLVDRLCETKEKVSTEIPNFVKLIISFLLERSFAVSRNSKRLSYAIWFKCFILNLKESEKIKYDELSNVLGISAETLMGFQSSGPNIEKSESIDALSERVAAIWNEAPPERRKNLDSFWYYLGKKHQDVSVSFKKMREILINLSLYYPRGPKIKNVGTNVKKPFFPHAIWEGDGKQIKIKINGVDFIYSWYAFCDQNTTLLVGSNIGKTESSVNFLSSLKNGRESCGTYSVGILIDNRLSDENLSPIRNFCKDHNIVLIRTFPGNSKSNGIIENNFSIFERFIGDININGLNSEEIARSIARNVIEIFTQLRNHSERGRLNGKCPDDFRNAKRPDQVRSALEKLAARFTTKDRNINGKWHLIYDARSKFEQLSDQSELKIKNLLGNFTIDDIIAAQAAYLAQIAKYPDKEYRSEYFMAILRHKRETKAKYVYNEAYRSGILSAFSFADKQNGPPKQTAKTVVDEIVAIQNEATPTHQMLRLEALSWWLVAYRGKNSLLTLWRFVGDIAAEKRDIELRYWQRVNEYLSERIGELLYADTRPTPMPKVTSKACVLKSQFESRQTQLLP